MLITAVEKKVRLYKLVERSKKVEMRFFFKEIPNAFWGMITRKPNRNFQKCGEVWRNFISILAVLTTRLEREDKMWNRLN